MEEDDEEGAPSQGIGGVERRGLVDIFGQQVHPPAAAIAIGGLAVMLTECRGPARELLWPDTAEGGGRCRVICRGECCCRRSNVFVAWGH